MHNSSIDETNENKNHKLKLKGKAFDDDMTFGMSPKKTPKKPNKNSSENYNSEEVYELNYSKNKKLEEIKQKKEEEIKRGLSSLEEKKIESSKLESEKIKEIIPERVNARLVAPKHAHREFDDEEKEEDKDKNKKKKEWKSWSSEEKELFYEAIANGVNYKNLQKLFKNINDKIGTKSTEKIRDYYYRALKNVDRILKSVGESGINMKNRDEVLITLGCYGKLITSSDSKKPSKLDEMKKLSKHPRIYKKAALNLKKLIMKAIKSTRKKKLNEKSSRNSKNKQINKALAYRRDSRFNNNMGHQGYIMKVIDTDNCRRIPYEKFTVRITPFDYETYFKMIESNLSPRIEITVPYNKSIKQIIEILQDKWSNVTKKYKNMSLLFYPLSELWIPSDIPVFTVEASRAFDIGDIFTGYGCPSTNLIFMHYQWNEAQITVKSNLIKSESKFTQSNKQDLSSIVLENANIVSNSLLAQPTMRENQSPNDSMNNSQVKVEDVINSDNESEEDKEKSIVPLEQEYDLFDPLEFLGFYKLNKNTNDSDDDGDFDFLFEDNNIWDENNLNQNQPEEEYPHEERTVAKFTSPLKKYDEDIGIVNEDNNPYQGVAFFDRLRKNTDHPLTISECQSNQEHSQNIPVQENSNNNTEGLNRMLSFNDINSKLKSNSLTFCAGNVGEENKTDDKSLVLKKRISFQHMTEPHLTIKKDKNHAFNTPLNVSHESMKHNVMSLHNSANDQLNYSNQKIHSSNPRDKIMDNNFPYTENSNVFTSNYPLGLDLFGNESNYFKTNMFNHSNLFDMNSNLNLTSTFNRPEDSQMFKLNAGPSYFGRKENSMILPPAENNLDKVPSFTLPHNKIEKKEQNLQKKTKRKSQKDSQQKQPSKKKSRPIQLDEVLDSEVMSRKSDNKSHTGVLNKPKSKKGIENASSNITTNPLNSQNINISNTNPCIINQNNYFNTGLNNPINEVHNQPGFNMYNPLPHNLDIPHPNKFFSNNLNFQYNPMMDPQFIMMMKMNQYYRQMGYCNVPETTDTNKFNQALKK